MVYLCANVFCFWFEKGNNIYGQVNFYPVSDLLRVERPVIAGWRESSPCHVVTENRVCRCVCYCVSLSAYGCARLGFHWILIGAPRL